MIIYYNRPLVHLQYKVKIKMIFYNKTKHKIMKNMTFNKLNNLN